MDQEFMVSISRWLDAVTHINWDDLVLIGDGLASVDARKTPGDAR